MESGDFGNIWLIAVFKSIFSASIRHLRAQYVDSGLRWSAVDGLEPPPKKKQLGLVWRCRQ